ncbi:Nif11-like leader peptide family natural product precursor [Pleurocapsa sp. FMAR1]|uniref:Nif11-like leader peptide family natural product precursor n=1 Tax=Pleurocapsa sp. FMAR1 TaxID=3040204 RepID=UPI0029C6C7DB|nr:Nif11-like leader peptide family natural product precursor [Pleurocapsa sp. FMAR1]
MSKANLEQLRQEVAQYPALQERLNQASDNDSLIALITEVGQEKGYSFTRQEVEEYINEMNTSQEISEEQLEAIAGGAAKADGWVNVIACF